MLASKEGGLFVFCFEALSTVYFHNLAKKVKIFVKCVEIHFVVKATLENTFEINIFLMKKPCLHYFDIASKGFIISKVCEDC